MAQQESVNYTFSPFKLKEVRDRAIQVFNLSKEMERVFPNNKEGLIITVITECITDAYIQGVKDTTKSLSNKK